MLTSRCARVARLGLRNRATAPLRSFQSERQGQRDPAPRLVMFSNPFFCSVPSLSPSQPASTGGRARCPPEDYLRWPPCSAGFFVKGERPRTHSSKKKIMKTNTNSDSRLQNRTAQRNSEQLHRIDFRQRFSIADFADAKVLDMLYHETPRFWELCQVVGKWVWIQFAAEAAAHRDGRTFAAWLSLEPEAAGLAASVRAAFENGSA
jgi:hypothetical protein